MKLTISYIIPTHKPTSPFPDVVVVIAANIKAFEIMVQMKELLKLGDSFSDFNISNFVTVLEETDKSFIDKHDYMKRDVSDFAEQDFVGSRVVMPLSLEEYQMAQMYMVMKMQQENTTGTEGVEVLENRPFEDDEFGKGQYTLKLYRLQSKVPSWLTTFAPADALVMQEEAWNSFPRCKSVIKCPYFTKFCLTVETIHKADNGQSENVHGLSKNELAAREVEMLDIASATSDYWSYIIGRNNIDFSTFQSARTCRGPLEEGWQDRCNPVMTAYKLVTVDAPYWGFGSRLEQALLTGERALFLESHRNCFAWIDEWFGLTMEVMRKLEQQSDTSLNEKLGRHCLVESEEVLDNTTSVFT